MSKNNTYQNITNETCQQAVIFARVSSEKQERGASIDAQKESIYDYCYIKNLNIIKEFIITESSMKGDRKQYQEMLKFILSKKCKIAIVVNCVDRLQRSYKDTPMLDDLRKQGKIEVHFLKENLILSKDSKGMDILFWNMCVLMANSYVLSLSDNVRRSFEFNWAQGKWQSLAPIGYLNRRDAEGKAIIIIDKQRAPMIKQIFEEYATRQHSSYSLAKFANNLGLTTKELCHKKSSIYYKQYKPINANTILAILRNPFYYGMMRIKGKLMPHIHGSIISEELFNQVQDILESRSSTKNNFFRPNKHSKRPFPFKGLITCSNCGKLMTADSKVKNEKILYTYIRCYHKCGQPTINENILLKQLEDELFKKLYIPKSKLTVIKNLINKKLDQLSLNIAENKKKIAKQLNDMKNREEKLIELFIAEKIDEVIYDQKITELSNKRETTKQQLESLKIVDRKLKETIEKTIDILTNLSYLMKVSGASTQNELLNLVIKNCTLNNKVLSYTVKSPFNKLLACTNHSKWADIITSNLSAFSNIQYSIQHLNL